MPETPHDPGPWWLRWLPADSRRAVRQRGFIVWGVAAFIALLQWLINPALHPLGPGLAYSYAISTATWFLCDPVRVALHRWLGSAPPHYWVFNARSIAYLVLAVVAGYAIGTAVGDAASGRPTWSELLLAPQRLWAFLLWSAGISAAFLFFFYHREKARALEHLATETRLKLLESQLEPHMLFNTLANLRALIGNDPARATAMLDQLVDYLRATLAASRSEGAGEHSLALEFQRLGDYLGLMGVRMGPRLRCTLDLPEALAAHPLPPLLLQPLVENAIRHGLEPSVQGGDIEVSAQAQGGALRITVRDTGVGFDGEPHAGFGLSQVRERLATAFGPLARLDWISAAGQGTVITLTLPLQT